MRRARGTIVPLFSVAGAHVVDHSLREWNLDAQPGDLLYLCDRRWWLGGLRSAHAIVEQVIKAEESTVELGPDTFERVVARTRSHQPILVERMY